MKHKASLVLMEQLVMILVFALAAALCLQIFAKAVAISERNAHLDQAVILARNTAELLKATKGDPLAAEGLSREGYQVVVTPLPAPCPGLAQARIRVFFHETELFALDTGWQEELP